MATSCHGAQRGFDIRRCVPFAGTTSEDLVRLLQFPTPDPFLNLGITSFVVYLVLRLVTGLEYVTWWVTLAYCIVYLILMTVAKPSYRHE